MHSLRNSEKKRKSHSISIQICLCKYKIIAKVLVLLGQLLEFGFFVDVISSIEFICSISIFRIYSDEIRICSSKARQTRREQINERKQIRLTNAFVWNEREYSISSAYFASDTWNVRTSADQAGERIYKLMYPWLRAHKDARVKVNAQFTDCNKKKDPKTEWNMFGSLSENKYTMTLLCRNRKMNEMENIFKQSRTSEQQKKKVLIGCRYVDVVCVCWSISSLFPRAFVSSTDFVSLRNSHMSWSDEK